MAIQRPHRAARAFSLVEVLVATLVLAIILVVVFGVTQQTGNAWQRSAARIDSFRAARAAFESMTRRISQATLNNYWGYDDPLAPTKYLRKSELHFICGKKLLGTSPQQVTHSIFFQAPLGYTDDASLTGMDTMLNACGYYLEYNNDSSRPAFLESLPTPPPHRYRFRLMQMVQPAQEMAIYDPAAGSGSDWFTKPLKSANPPVRQVAENIIALIILPKRSARDEATAAAAGKKPLTIDYEYDTRQSDATRPYMENQLPPLVEVIMVAVDEPSFSHFGNSPVAPNLGLAGLFQDPSVLDASGGDEHAGDLDKLEDVLAAKPGNIAGNTTKLNYRIFRTDVPIRAAKWSSND